MNYKVIDKEKYYRKGVFRHFSEDCHCSTSMTARIDVTEGQEIQQGNVIAIQGGDPNRDPNPRI